MPFFKYGGIFFTHTFTLYESAKRTQEIIQDNFNKVQKKFIFLQDKDKGKGKGKIVPVL
jgi:hypothetical protein